jgi:hypothetical protein
MKNVWFISFCLFSLSAAGCSGDAADDPAETGGSGGGGTGGGSGSSGASGTGGGNACGAAITANVVNNYSFSSTLSFPPITVQPDTELTFDWSSVTTDFLGHPIDPRTGVDSVNLMLWHLTQEELQTKLNADALAQRDLAVIASYYTDNMVTEAPLFSFTSVGMPLTPEVILPYVSVSNYPPEDFTYTVMIAVGEELGQGTRMIQAFKLDPNSTNTRVSVTSTSTHLEYSVDMHSLQPTPVPAGTGAITIEWGAMTVNALGNEFYPTDITEALVAHYTQTPAELESQFLDLNLIHSGMWRGPVAAGTNISLSTFTNEQGQPFTGIDSSGTWIVALVCGSCRNPAPWYLSVLTPCSQ